MLSVQTGIALVTDKQWRRMLGTTPKNNLLTSRQYLAYSVSSYSKVNTGTDLWERFIEMN